MARKKNALTKHFVAPIPTDGITEPEYMRLAKYISSVEDEPDEDVEDIGFYDGDGTPESDVMTVKKTYTFEGFYDDEDEAMKFIAGLEFETGEGRKIMYKQERSNGDVYEGRATVTDIVPTGGEATEYATFGCAISWDAKPEITRAGEGGGGVEG